MNTFIQNQTLEKDNVIYTVTLRKKDFLLLRIESDDIIIRQFPIRMIGQYEYVTVNGFTLLANDFTGPSNSVPVTRDFTKEEAEKLKEYLSTLWTGWKNDTY